MMLNIWKKVPSLHQLRGMRTAIVFSVLLCKPVVGAQPDSVLDSDSPVLQPAKAEQPQADTVPLLETLIAQLDDAHLAMRDNAMVTIFERSDMSLEKIENLLDTSQASLSPEQRLRLEQLALGLFMRGPRAALGISFGGEHPQGTPIARTVEGFAAAQLLQAGDIVLSADRIPTHDQEALRVAILAHAPGETINLSIVRDGKPMEINVPLGSFQSLQSAMRPPEMSLLVAWTIRQGRRHAALAMRDAGADQTARLGLLIPQYNAAIIQSQADYWPEPDTLDWERVFGTADVPSWLGMGGQPRHMVADISIHEMAAGSLASELLGLDGLGANGLGLGNGAGVGGFIELNDASAVLALLRTQRVDLLRKLGTIQRHIAELADEGNADDAPDKNPDGNRPKNTPASRAELDSQLALVQQRLDALDVQISQLQAEQRTNVQRR